VDRAQISELHYITAIENVGSILGSGILSHNRVRKVRHQSVAMEVIQARRAKKRIPGARALHDYVNLYINGRNPMMFTVLQNHPLDGLCLLAVSTDVLDLPGTIIADQNASSDYVRFANAPPGLALIDRGTVFAVYWTHPDDQIAEWRHKSAMCAEVLVPDVVEPNFISSAYVGSQVAEQALQAVAPTMSVTRDGYKFFR
jgi:ssDNA thymidine ADP-ribosyltransferase, DarT